MGCRPTTREVPFETLLSLPLRNGLTKPKAQRGSGVKMISMGELFSSNRIGCMPMDRVPVTDKELELSCIAPSDLLFARQSLVLEGAGKCSFVKEVSEPTVFESHLIRARIDRAKAEPEYLYYFFKSPQGRERIASIVEQVAAAGIRGRDLARLSIPCPELDFQRRVVTLLSCIDNKIDANAKLNGYLEELLLAKYDKLFPVNADFTGILSDVGTVIGGATPSKKRSEYYCSNGIGWITPRDLSNTSDKFIAHGADDITDEGYASCSAKLLPKGSVLFSSRAPIGYVAIATNEVATNQGFKSVVPKEEIGTAFVYCFLVRNKQRIADMGAGTTFPEVSGKMMKSVELAVPEQSLCAEFNVFAEPILKQQETLERENRDLAALRNALLPKLMSGEIDVTKVDLTQLNSHLAKYFMFTMASLSICQ